MKDDKSPCQEYISLSETTVQLISSGIISSVSLVGNKAFVHHKRVRENVTALSHYKDYFGRFNAEKVNPRLIGTFI